MALLPLAFSVWMMSIFVPTALETWRANGDIFKSRKDQPNYASLATPAPTAMPESVRALLTATAQGTPASALSTTIPIEAPNPSGTATPGSSGSQAQPPFDDEADLTPRESNLPPTPTAEPLPDWNGSDPIHILLLGVDTRPSEESEGRSDTMIVVRVDPQAMRVDMFSIPRDLAVSIPGFGDGYKINSAYPWGELYEVDGGGPGLVAQSIALNFGVAIDYFATVDIPGLESIVDTLGGVIVDVDAPVKDDQYPTEDFRYTRVYFPSGLQMLTGKKAVQYARTRHADGDFQRAQRQQKLLLAIRDRVLGGGFISNLADLVGDLRDTVRTDLSPRQVLSLASLAQGIDRANIWVHSLAPYTFASSTAEGWFLLGDWDALRWITQNLDQDPLATNMPDG